MDDFWRVKQCDAFCATLTCGTQLEGVVISEHGVQIPSDGVAAAHQWRSVSHMRVRLNNGRCLALYAFRVRTFTILDAHVYNPRSPPRWKKILSSSSSQIVD